MKLAAREERRAPPDRRDPRTARPISRPGRRSPVVAGGPRDRRPALGSRRADPSKDDAAGMKRVYEEWARPVRLHHFQGRRDGLHRLLGAGDARRGRGASRIFRLNDAAVTEVAVSGELWATPGAQGAEARRRRGTPLVRAGVRLVPPGLAQREGDDGAGAQRSRGLAGDQPAGDRARRPALDRGPRGGRRRGRRRARRRGSWLGSIGTIGHGAGTGFDPLRYLPRRAGARARQVRRRRPARHRDPRVDDHRGRRRALRDRSGRERAGASSAASARRRGSWSCHASSERHGRAGRWSSEPNPDRNRQYRDRQGAGCLVAAASPGLGAAPP